jgi:CubicO group peptidase (beta-lactamase class C family)
MTATLCAKLVEQGRLDFDAPASNTLRGVRVHPQFQRATLTHLLTHRAGLPANLDLAQYSDRNGQRERNRAVQAELAKPPASEPGSRYEYPNLGYIVAGNMVERATGKSWQANMQEHVFAPLAMRL